MGKPMPQPSTVEGWFVSRMVWYCVLDLIHHGNPRRRDESKTETLTWLLIDLTHRPYERRRVRGVRDACPRDSFWTIASLERGTDLVEAMVVFLRIVGVKPTVSAQCKAAWEKKDLKVLNDLLTKAGLVWRG